MGLSSILLIVFGTSVLATLVFAGYSLRVLIGGRPKRVAATAAPAIPAPLPFVAAPKTPPMLAPRPATPGTIATYAQAPALAPVGTPMPAPAATLAPAVALPTHPPVASQPTPAPLPPPPVVASHSGGRMARGSVPPPPPRAAITGQRAAATAPRAAHGEFSDNPQTLVEQRVCHPRATRVRN